MQNIQISNFEDSRNSNLDFVALNEQSSFEHSQVLFSTSIPVSTKSSMKLRIRATVFPSYFRLPPHKKRINFTILDLAVR